MKLPFSYKQSFFKSVLVVSCIGHGVFFAQAGFLKPAPQYGVVQAPASIEVVLIEEKPEELPEIKEEVMTAVEPSQDLPEVQQKKPEEIKEIPKPVEKPVSITPVKGAETEQKPTYLKNPAPVYPFRARQRGWEGVVLLDVLVSQEGRSSEIKLKKSSGHKMLDDAAIEAVSNWEFKPASLGKIAFSARIEIPVRFVLEP